MPGQFTFKWTDFYTEFATKLLDYEANRKFLIQKIQNVYTGIDMRFPRLDKDGIPGDIDPFTIYGLFNKGITNANRIAILGGIRSEFAVAADVPDDFSGIPVLNNMSANFYAFGDTRKPDDIQNLWTVFSAAIAFSTGDTMKNRSAFSTAYDRVLNQFGIRWNLTMGLYWIRPFTYLNLDSRNRWYLGSPENMPDDIASEVRALRSVPDAESYLALRDRCLEALRSGNYAYKTFPELSHKAWVTSEDANRRIRRELREQKRNALGDADVETVHYWLYAPGEGASMWNDFYDRGIMALGWSELGNLNVYTGKKEMARRLQEIHGEGTSFTNSAHAVWQFVHDLKPGHVVFAKRGRNEITGRGIVESDYEYDENGGEYPNIRRVRWTHRGSWDSGEKRAIKTLTDITNYQALVSKLAAFFEDGQGPGPVKPPLYTKDDFLKDVYMSEEKYTTLVRLLREKKNVLLRGAPGVGKTFMAKRLAYSIMGVKDMKRLSMVQFHQSYSYEDFIMGYRPSGAGFDLIKGPFYTFCKDAEVDTENDYFFIIDEINRGNLSKIFGELFMLIENDKRGEQTKTKLLYSDELFSVPENVYVIGMMNTADRSLAMMDYALRRRFEFFELEPAFSSDGFRAYQESLDNEKFDRLIQCVRDLNEKIAADESLGRGFCIGHSYFCGLTQESLNDGRLSRIVEYELIPLLEAYWFDEPQRAEEWAGRLRGALR